VERGVRQLLIVEDDDTQRNTLIELLGGAAGDGDADVAITGVSTAEEALQALEGGEFDTIVLDLALPGMSGIELLQRIKAEERYSQIPVIIYTGTNLSRQEEAKLKRNAVSVITKDVGSADRLLDDTALFLHRVVSRLPESKRKIIEERHVAPPSAPAKPSRRRTKASTVAPVTVSAGSTGNGRNTLAGHTILIVDDDVRNIFALTSALEVSGMRILFAENGLDSLQVLRDNPDIEVVLMDIMMPEMDGYETIQRIREAPEGRWSDLPIIALTAKAMSGDREKCLAAGATDYITKPVDMDQLREMLNHYLPEPAAIA
jgi:CheY-like chemotaxis protein